MKYPTESEVQKLGPVVRGLATFILFCGLLAGAGLGVAVVTEPFHPLVFVGVIIIGLLVHVSGSVVFKGYAPKYLLFAHGSK